MDQEDAHLSARPSDATNLSISASLETLHKSPSPHTATDIQPTTDNRMSSGTPDTGEEKDSSEPMLENNRTPASDISLLPSNGVQDVADTIEEQIFYKRELRPARGTVICTWIDADTTGDFDPREEARRARPRRKKAKTSHRGNHDWNGAKHTNEPAIEPEPESPPPPPLCIRFSSSAGKVAFSELCARLESEAKLSHDSWTTGYHLRKRKNISGDPFSGTLGVQATGVRVLASEKLSDFTNHPVARGCFDCLAIGARCSLLDNEHSWPCDDCKENGNDCHLVKEPEVKLACTHCQYLSKRQRLLVCSFEYDPDPSDHRGRCVECLKWGHRPCIAGPKPGHVSTRIRIGLDGEPYTIQPGNEKKASRKTTCLPCLESRRVCSFVTGSLYNDGEACTACDMAGEACEPIGSKAPQYRYQQSPQDSAQENFKESDVEHDQYEIVPTALAADQIFTHHSTTPPKPPADFPSPEQDAKIFVETGPVNDQAARHARNISPLPRSDSPAPVCGITKIVRTKLCHPVRFDYQDPTHDGSGPCHFCAAQAYSIIGLEEREMEVIEWDDGGGWEEVRGGHRGEDTKNTQVCPGCTLVRMRIMVCDKHALRPISGADDKQDLSDALDRLIDDTSRETWCSVCCNLAAQECCSEQEYEEREGCGLALCESCAVDLKRSGGSFQAMLQQLEDEPTGERPVGLRADYELLKHDGLLMGYLKAPA